LWAARRAAHKLASKKMKNYLKKIGSNRRLAAGRLEIDFKKPFNLLAKLPAEARGEAPSEATNSMWCGFTTTLETILAKIPEKIQFVPSRCQVPFFLDTNSEIKK